MSTRSDAFRGRVYYVCKSRRHWIPTPEHAEAWGLPFPEGIQWVAPEVVEQLPLCGSVPLPWSLSDFRNPPERGPAFIREIAASQLSGRGIEIGAGWNPFPVPLDCDVVYADRWTRDDYLAKYHANEEKPVDVVASELRLDFDRFHEISDSSVDFLIACHVIEHTRNPLQVLKAAYQKLKTGGSFILVVPDKRYTFDKDRELTSLEHLILDYESPLPERDWPHFFEFTIKVLGISGHDAYDRAVEAFRADGDIHFHTWTYESFLGMVEYCIQMICPWREVWSHPVVIAPPGGAEFYVVLSK